jgi:peptidoglycan/LPS O-acetylase OafA/YrhL
MTNQTAVATEAPSQRIYALDGLRTLMLFFVVLFHCVLAYTASPAIPWQFKDDTRTVAADIIVGFVHLFTLPTFFILAGFFAAMLYAQRGVVEFLRNRGIRIGIPLLAGWMTLIPLTIAGFGFAHVYQQRSLGAALALAGSALASGRLLFVNTTGHLWFMYYLLLFYLLLVGMAQLLARLPRPVRDGVPGLVAAVVEQPFVRLPVLALLTLGILSAVGSTLLASMTFVPSWKLVLGYGFYFAFGTFLYFRRDVIAKFKRLAWTQTLLGVGSYFVVLPILREVLAAEQHRAIYMLLSAFAVWLYFFGLTGLFLRYLNRPSVIIRYIVDASFWIYLLHLPLVAWLQGLFSKSAAPGGLKILTIIALVYIIGLLSYDLFVRSTSIGAVLSGRRFPRVLFRFGAPVPAT